MTPSLLPPRRLLLSLSLLAAAARPASALAPRARPPMGGDGGVDAFRFEVFGKVRHFVAPPPLLCRLFPGFVCRGGVSGWWLW